MSSSYVYGHCRTCNGLGVYFNVLEHSYHYLDGRPHEGHEVDFMADASLAPENPVQQVTENMTPPKVAQRITDARLLLSICDLAGKRLDAFHG